MLTERLARQPDICQKYMPASLSLQILLDIDERAGEETSYLPALEFFDEWIGSALRERDKAKPSSVSPLDHEVSIRLVGRAEMKALNKAWRDRDASTNVLSFPSGLPSLPRPSERDLQALGDLVFCPAVVEAEAQSQQKRIEHHWAHLVIHGTLHLCGYDHQTEAEATTMEAVEIRLLSRRLIPDPYGVRAHFHD